jgi:raffinose/stachyose/melibiose transport system substrate-binding protein
MKKLAFAFLILAVAAGFAAAADQATLTVWYPETDEASKAIAAQWQAAHPEVKLNVVLKGGDYKQELQLALQSGEGPDLCAVNQSASEMGLFADQGLVISLDPYVKKYNWGKGIGASFLKPNYWDTKTHRLGTAGQTYTVANAIESAIVYYNKSLFAKAGITRTPTTWEEWEKDAEILKKAGITPIVSGIAGQDGWCALHQVEVQIERFMTRKQANAFVFAEKGASFNLPEVIKGAKNIQDWVKKGWYNDGFTGVGWDDSEKMFVAGRGAMFMSGTWAAQDFTRLAKETPIEWDVFKLPSHMVFGSVATGWGISKSCKNPDLAADFLNAWVMDYATHVTWNMLPLNLDGLMKDKNIEIAPQFKHMIDVIGQVSREDGIGYYFDWPTPSMYDTMTANCQKLMGLQITPEDFAKAIDKDLQAYLASRK